MAHLVLTLILTVSVYFPAAALERATSEGTTGEKDTGLYAGPFWPSWRVDGVYGRVHWADDEAARDHFLPLLWNEAGEFERFFAEDLPGASACADEQLSAHFEELRYAHRLLALSYILEAADAAAADLVRLRRPDKACRWDLTELTRSCRPQSADMTQFLKGLVAQNPFTDKPVDAATGQAEREATWLAEVRGNALTPGAARAQARCRQKGCSSLSDAAGALEVACAEDRALFRTICSEEDHLYGLSAAPVMSYLLGSSNLMSQFNTGGQGPGCLRRFGALMSRKEHVPVSLAAVAPVVHAALKARFGNRYPLGRAFVYGALKEIRDKGLADVFEAPKVPAIPEPVAVAPTPVASAPAPKPAPAVAIAPAPKPVPPKPKAPEVAEIPKSAFLQAAEVRRGQDLDRVDVDMLKLRYDHVFDLHEFQLLSATLKEYTTRRALEEMKQHDNLGDRPAPVPLSFLKFLVDGQNHQGLYNMVNVLGDRFWVMNDVDARWKPSPEYVEIKNDESTGRQWQLWVIRPR